MPSKYLSTSDKAAAEDFAHVAGEFLVLAKSSTVWVSATVDMVPRPSRKNADKLVSGILDRTPGCKLPPASPMCPILALGAGMVSLGIFKSWTPNREKALYGNWKNGTGFAAAPAVAEDVGGTCI